MAQKIFFEYKGELYAVDVSAYDLEIVILPDGTALRILNWSESSPPQPGNIIIVPHSFHHLTPEIIAKQLNAVLAEKVKPCKVRIDWLMEHALLHQEWSLVIGELIASDVYIVVPSKYAWLNSGEESPNLAVLESSVKGSPALFRLVSDVVECVNYPGSHPPIKVSGWLKWVKDLAQRTDRQDALIQQTLSQ